MSPTGGEHTRGVVVRAHSPPWGPICAKRPPLFWEQMDAGAKEATCAECAALWRVYAKATVEHVELMMRKERTTWTTIVTAPEMESLICEAASHRDAARMAIENHLRSAHTART